MHSLTVATPCVLLPLSCAAGKRFRKLCKLLLSSSVTRTLQQFKWFYVGTVVGILIVDLVAFLIMLTIIRRQEVRLLSGVILLFSLSAAYAGLRLTRSTLWSKIRSNARRSRSTTCTAWASPQLR